MERKAGLTRDERKQYRLAHYRAEIKTPESSEFRIIAPGSGGECDSARCLSALESIRRVVYPELSRGIRMDRSRVTLLRE